MLVTPATTHGRFRQSGGKKRRACSNPESAATLSKTTAVQSETSRGLAEREQGETSLGKGAALRLQLASAKKCWLVAEPALSSQCSKRHILNSFLSWVRNTPGLRKIVIVRGARRRGEARGGNIRRSDHAKPAFDKKRLVGTPPKRWASNSSARTGLGAEMERKKPREER